MLVNVVMSSHLVVHSSEIIASFHVKRHRISVFFKINSHVAISYRSIPFPNNIVYVGNEPSASSIHLPFIKMGLCESLQDMSEKAYCIEERDNFWKQRRLLL